MPAAKAEKQRFCVVTGCHIGNQNQELNKGGVATWDILLRETIQAAV